MRRLNDNPSASEEALSMDAIVPSKRTRPDESAFTVQNTDLASAVSILTSSMQAAVRDNMDDVSVELQCEENGRQSRTTLKFRAYRRRADASA
jgi:hypothetical protein